ncbi:MULTISPECIES: hypothetical protein [Streptomyces]|uniref:hypothetical protein n=1 Tax=Streptomyces TaxID=1883 RepID=UPI00073E01AD|nr:hypothetical protein [Streptomyces sp. EAS-AB2608]MYU30547.1 hypothetical protein [Streptomyces sp. SID7810]BCM70014.1 hypothetical protein EASAB2608_05348 [Streptomyces sp. EAS-AB2608]CUW31617.1 hypothetical protein TUE45_06365 [Streptomyces reticuli]
MRETPDTGRKRIDLSVPQVAGSALAAVVAAKLASYFGVYGTILGAGVVSVVATCGGSVFQHFFKRTGEQLREKTVVAARPRERAPVAPGEFTEGTVYRARVKSWRRPLVAAALVFGVTMAGITAYELVSGSSFSGGRGTTVSDAVTGRGSSGAKSDDRPAPSGTPSPEHTPSADGGTTRDTAPTPGHSPNGEPGGEPGGTPGDEPSGAPATPATPTAPTPSASGTPTAPATTPTPPAPSASSRSGTADPGRDDPSGR